MPGFGFCPGVPALAWAPVLGGTEQEENTHCLPLRRSLSGRVRG